MLRRVPFVTLSTSNVVSLWLTFYRLTTLFFYIFILNINVCIYIYRTLKTRSSLVLRVHIIRPIRRSVQKLVLSLFMPLLLIPKMKNHLFEGSYGLFFSNRFFFCFILFHSLYFISSLENAQHFAERTQRTTLSLPSIDACILNELNHLDGLFHVISQNNQKCSGEHAFLVEL